jgi:hypothetical protein
VTNTTITLSIRRAILRSANQPQANIAIEVIPGIALAPRRRVLLLDHTERKNHRGSPRRLRLADLVPRIHQARACGRAVDRASLLRIAPDESLGRGRNAGCYPRVGQSPKEHHASYDHLPAH